MLIELRGIRNVVTMLLNVKRRVCVHFNDNVNSSSSADRNVVVVTV
jgi:hypothetical protein